MPFPDPGTPETLDPLPLFSRCHCIGTFRGICDACQRLVDEARQRGRRWAERLALRDVARLQQPWPVIGERQRHVATELAADILPRVSAKARDQVIAAVSVGGADRWQQLRWMDAAKIERVLAWARRREAEQAANVTPAAADRGLAPVRQADPAPRAVERRGGIAMRTAIRRRQIGGLSPGDTLCVSHSRFALTITHRRIRLRA